VDNPFLFEVMKSYLPILGSIEARMNTAPQANAPAEKCECDQVLLPANIVKKEDTKLGFKLHVPRKRKDVDGNSFLFLNLEKKEELKVIVAILRKFLSQRWTLSVWVELDNKGEMTWHKDVENAMKKIQDKESLKLEVKKIIDLKLNEGTEEWDEIRENKENDWWWVSVE